VADKMSIEETVAVQREAARVAKIESFGVAGGGAQAVFKTPSGPVAVERGELRKITKEQVEQQLQQ